MEFRLPFRFIVTVWRDPKNWCHEKHILDGKTLCPTCRTTYSKNAYLGG